MDNGNIEVTTGLVHGRDGTYEYLQLNVCDVDPGSVAGMPDPDVLRRRLLRENVVPLPKSRYGYEARLSAGDVEFTAQGLVTACLALRGERPQGARVERQRSEVRDAHQRGLLDDLHRAKADFRLSIRPTRSKIEALYDSRYVPDDEWRIDVIFAHWFRQPEHEFVLTPLAGASADELELEFRPLRLARGFRVSDLFS